MGVMLGVGFGVFDLDVVLCIVYMGYVNVY